MHRTIIKPLVFLVGIGAGVLALVYGTLGRTTFEKMVTDTAMPLGLLSLTLITLVVIAVHRRQRAWAGVLAVLFFALMTVGSRPLGRWLIGTLETPYREIDPLQGPAMEAVLLLGGATGETPFGGVQVNANGDRVVMAARLYHAGLAQTIYCSGAVPKSNTVLLQDEGEHAASLLQSLRVPDSAIRRVAGGNTSEELLAIEHELGDQPIGVITNAWHLGRAMRLAEARGVNAVPIPCGFLSGSGQPRPAGVWLREWIPHHQGTYMIGKAMHEYLARIASR